MKKILKISPSTEQIQLILINSLRDFCVSHVKTKQTLSLLGCHGSGLGPVPPAPSMFWSQQWKEVNVSPQQEWLPLPSPWKPACIRLLQSKLMPSFSGFQQCVNPVQTAGGGSGPAATCLKNPDIPAPGGLGRAVGKNAKRIWQIWWWSKAWRSRQEPSEWPNQPSIS